MKRSRLVEQAQVARDLAGLLRLGYSPVEAVQRVQTSQSPEMARALGRCVERMQKGESLSRAMKEDKAFWPLFVRLVESAECSEHFSPGLERTAAILDELSARRSRSFLAVLYPTLVFTIVFVLLWGVCVSGGSFFTNLFEHANLALPFPTRVLVVVSRVGSGPLGIAVFIVPIVALWSVVLGVGGLGWYVYKIPLVGAWLLRQEAVIFVKTLGHLMEIGVPLADASRLALEACSDPVRARLGDLPSRLESGDKLGTVLRQSRVLPELGVWAIERREATENLRLLEIGRLLDRELDVSLNRGLVVFEPLVFLGVLFGLVFFVMAVMLPLYQLIGNLG